MGTLYHKTHNEDNAYGLITMKSGVMVLFDLNHFNKAKDLVEYDLYLEKGVVRYTPETGIVEEQGETRRNVEFVKVNPQFDSLKDQLENFIGACEGRAKLDVTAQDGLRVMEMLESLYKSSKKMERI
jgi:predicted dehydrogenase